MDEEHVEYSTMLEELHQSINQEPYCITLTSTSVFRREQTVLTFFRGFNLIMSAGFFWITLYMSKSIAFDLMVLLGE